MGQRGSRAQAWLSGCPLQLLAAVRRVMCTKQAFNSYQSPLAVHCHVVLAWYPRGGVEAGQRVPLAVAQACVVKGIHDVVDTSAVSDVAVDGVQGQLFEIGVVGKRGDETVLRLHA